MSERERQRDLDLGEDLPLGHPERARGVDRLAVDRLEPRVGAGQQRRDGEDDQYDRDRQQADADEQDQDRQQAQRRQRHARCC